MLINSIHLSLYDISLTQNILYQIKRDVAVWKRLGCPQRNQRTWWQIVATPYTGLEYLSRDHSIKLSSYQYRDPHVKDKIFNMGILYPGKTVFILRRGPGHWSDVPCQGLHSQDGFWGSECLFVVRSCEKTPQNYTEVWQAFQQHCCRITSSKSKATRQFWYPISVAALPIYCDKIMSAKLIKACVCPKLAVDRVFGLFMFDWISPPRLSYMASLSWKQNSQSINQSINLHLDTFYLITNISTVLWYWCHLILILHYQCCHTGFYGGLFRTWSKNKVH